MREWTTEERYRELKKEDLGLLKELHDQVRQSPWRCVFHVQPVTGLMGDTNGFSCFDGRWHLFYQWFPYGAVHGLKHWYHVSSTDLLTWKNEGLGIGPGEIYDDKGVFSGSGYPEGDILYLPFTGNHRDENWVRTPYQLLAYMTKDGIIHKQEEPLYGPVDGYTEHQRDPKMFYREEDGYYYYLLGVQNEEKKGKFLLMKSKQIQSGWQIAGELKIRGYDDFGFMVECPDLEKVGDQWLLLFSPQGLEPQGDEFHNIYNNTYLIGQMDFDHLEFIPEGRMKELDRGFDFYAAQCAGQKIWPDKAVMCAWFGVSDYSYPPANEDGYSGLQTMARILTIEDGELKQRPCEAAYSLKSDIVLNKKKGEKAVSGRMPKASVIEVKAVQGDVSLRLWCSEDRPGFTVKYDAADKALVIDKSGLINQLNTDYGTSRRVVLENGLKEMQIFADCSSIEIFVNDGEYVLSARVFPENTENGIYCEGEGAEISVYNAGTTVKDDFVIFPEQAEK